MAPKNWKLGLCSLLLALLLLPGIPFGASAEEDTDYLQALARLVTEYESKAGTGGSAAPSAEAFTARSAGAAEAFGPYHSRRLLAKTTGGTIADSHGAAVVLPLPDNRFALQYETEQAAADARRLLAQDPNVLYAEPDGVVRAAAVSWGVAAIGADEFQKILPTKLPEIKVAVLDTGLDVNHKHFTGRISDVRWNFYTGAGNVTDGDGHGTHVAGILTDASSSNVQVMPLKVLDDYGNGYNSVAMEAVRYAADKGAKVVNMSFAGEYTASASGWSDTVNYAYDHGVKALFAATGNDGRILKTYPAATPGVIAVLASGRDNCPAGISNIGTYVDIGAPGVDIYSAIPGGGYAYGSGTSMATPFASAAAALLLSHNSKLTGDDILACLQSTSTPWGSGGDLYGAGIVNIKPRTEARPSEFTMNEGDCGAFQSMVVCPPIPGARFTYTSANPAVAAVSQYGGVQALRPGETTITITAPDFRAEAPVKVWSSSRPQVASGVTIKSVKVKTQPNVTTFKPGQAVSGIGGRVLVTYSDGVVDDIYVSGEMCSAFDPYRLGTQTVTADYSGHTVTFAIRVAPDDIPESLDLRYNSYFLFPYGEYNGVRWESSNGKVLTVDAGGVIEYHGHGSAVVSTLLDLPGEKTETLGQTQVHVRFSWLQWFMYIFLFGFLWM